MLHPDRSIFPSPLRRISSKASRHDKCFDLRVFFLVRMTSAIGIIRIYLARNPLPLHVQDDYYPVLLSAGLFLVACRQEWQFRGLEIAAGVV